MNTDLRPIYLTDKLTFCSYLFQACLEKGAVHPSSKRKFVEDCADNFPSTGLRDVPRGPYNLDGLIKWNFNGDAATAIKYNTSPARNFTLWDSSPLESSNPGRVHDHLKAVADKLSKDQCNNFGNGDASHVVSEDTHNAMEANKLLFQGIDQGFWEKLGFGAGAIALGILAFLSGADFMPIEAFGFSGTSTFTDPMERDPLQI